MLFFAKSEKSIWNSFGKMIRNPQFQISPSEELYIFLNKNKKHLLRKKINPYQFIFYSPLDQKTDSQTFINLIIQTHNFIKDNQLPFSLNDNHAPLGFDSPLLESFFHWGSWHISPKLIKTIVDCGHNFNPEFYNKSLHLTHGLEISETKNSPCHKKGNSLRKWNFLVLVNILKESLASDFKLDQRNLDYLKEISLEELSENE